MRHDFCIIGGGIVGLATALDLLKQRPGSKLVLLEKEAEVGFHQTGHNSGVIHAGIYYAPGSLKARLCVEGNRATKAFCSAHEVPFETCGKLLVATDGAELVRMDAIAEHATLNGIEFRRLDASELRTIEPNIVGVGALLVPSTGLVDYRLVSRAMANEIRKLGGQIHLEEKVIAIRESGADVSVRTDRLGEVRASKLVVCGGLQSDRLAELAGLSVDHRIVPFRGEYFRLPDSKADIIKHHIYPVPNPALPFLGVHMTRMADGGITIGPNAVLARSREGYAKGSTSIRDMIDIASFSGFWRVLGKHLQPAIQEAVSSASRQAFLALSRKYCPSLKKADLTPHPSGIRAQAVLRDGTLVHDFLFKETSRMVHVLNAPSPAATSALPIGQMIAQRLLGRANSLSRTIETSDALSGSEV
jgi:(S)-2-hydroxyglutarate dehydrogenase